MKKYFLLTLFLLFIFTELFSQVILPNSWQDLYERHLGILEVQHSNQFWSPFDTNQSKPGFFYGPVDFFSSYNLSFPYGLADGALWQGKGFNTRLIGGAGYKGEYFDFYCYPEIGFSQNAPFDLNPFTTNPPFGDAHGRTWDHPERFGENVLYYFSPGQSRISLFYNQARLSLGTENKIWGASRYNSILLSAQGPGFPHLELALDPAEYSIGIIQASLIYGYLAPSAYRFKVNDQDGNRFWSGLFASYSPWFYKNLTLSAGRTILSYWQKLGWQDFVMPFNLVLDLGVDKFDQRMCLSYRLVEPAIGLELYGEWARNDFSPSINQFYLNLEHTHNWILGFRKTCNFNHDYKIMIEGELANMSLYIENFINLNGYNPEGGDFYSHWLINEAYTVKGQDIGAAAGNGNMQFIAFYLFNTKYYIGLEVSRFIKDYSVLISTSPKPGDEFLINALTTTTLRGGFNYDSWRFSFGLAGLFESNRYFIRDNFTGSFNMNFQVTKYF